MKEIIGFIAGACYASAVFGKDPSKLLRIPGVKLHHHHHHHKKDDDKDKDDEKKEVVVNV